MEIAFVLLALVSWWASVWVAEGNREARRYEIESHDIIRAMRERRR